MPVIPTFLNPASPVIFLCKVRLPVIRPVKDRFAYCENLPLRPVEERIYRILLALTDRQSCWAEKIIRLPVPDVSEGK